MVTDAGTEVRLLTRTDPDREWVHVTFEYLDGEEWKPCPGDVLMGAPTEDEALFHASEWAKEGVDYHIAGKHLPQ